MIPRPKLDDPNTLTFDPGTKPLTGWEEVMYIKGMKEGFEKGVDAGRKWGHEEKDEEIRKLLRNHTEYLRVAPSERFVPVEHIEALL